MEETQESTGASVPRQCTGDVHGGGQQRANVGLRSSKTLFVPGEQMLIGARKPKCHEARAASLGAMRRIQTRRFQLSDAPRRAREVGERRFDGGRVQRMKRCIGWSGGMAQPALKLHVPRLEGRSGPLAPSPRRRAGQRQARKLSGRRPGLSCLRPSAVLPIAPPGPIAPLRTVGPVAAQCPLGPISESTPRARLQSGALRWTQSESWICLGVLDTLPRSPAGSSRDSGLNRFQL